MSLLSPFIDTILVCSMTALVIIITGVYNNADGIQGVELTSQAFESVFMVSNSLSCCNYSICIYQLSLHGHITD